MDFVEAIVKILGGKEIKGNGSVAAKKVLGCTFPRPEGEIYYIQYLTSNGSKGAIFTDEYGKVEVGGQQFNKELLLQFLKEKVTDPQVYFGINTEYKKIGRADNKSVFIKFLAEEFITHAENYKTPTSSK